MDNIEAGKEDWQTVKRKPRSTNKRDTAAAAAAVELQPSLPETVPELPRVVTFCQPHSDDMVFNRAQQLVIRHNRRSFATFTDPIRMEALTNAPAEVEEIAIIYRGAIIPIPFKIVMETSRPSHALMCNVKGGWTPFVTWLNSLKDPP
jgi:hypothetical protein